jgi:predicted HTH transcriptional regulator
MFDYDDIVFPAGSASPEAQETSIAALESLDPGIKARREQQICEYIKTNGGATSCEVETSLGLLHQSASPAITKLKKAGYIVNTGKRRRRDTGRKAIVWRVVNA